MRQIALMRTTTYCSMNAVFELSILRGSTNFQGEVRQFLFTGLRFQDEIAELPGTKRQDCHVLHSEAARRVSHMDVTNDGLTACQEKKIPG